MPAGRGPVQDPLYDPVARPRGLALHFLSVDRMRREPTDLGIAAPIQSAGAKGSGTPVRSCRSDLPISEGLASGIRQTRLVPSTGKQGTS